MNKEDTSRAKNERDTNFKKINKREEEERETEGKGCKKLVRKKQYKVKRERGGGKEDVSGGG